MMTIDELVDAAKERTGCSSDRAYGRRLGYAAATVNGWRTKRCWPSDDVMAQVARDAEIDPTEALIWLNIWRNQGAARAEYERLLARFTRTAAALLVVLCGIGFFGSTQAVASPIVSAQPTALLYIMKNLDML